MVIFLLIWGWTLSGCGMNPVSDPVESISSTDTSQTIDPAESGRSEEAESGERDSVPSKEEDPAIQERVFEISYFFEKPSRFNEIDSFVRSYFRAWEAGDTVPASEEVITRWKPFYSDLSFSSFKDTAYLNKRVMEDGSIEYSFSFRYERAIREGESSCVLEVVAFGCLHLLELVQGDQGWYVVRDLGSDDMYVGFTGEDREEALAVYRQAAEQLMAGISQEEIESAVDAVKRGFLTMPVFFGVRTSGADREIETLLSRVRTEPYTDELNLERITEYIWNGHHVPLHDPLVILRATAEGEITINGRTYVLSGDFSEYPPVVVRRTEEGWQYSGLSIWY